MASANLDLVRSISAAWERRDFSSTEWAHPEIEYVIADGPEPGHHTGLVEMAAFWRDFLSSWEDVATEVEEYRELDGERVLVLHRFSARGKTSGLGLGQVRSNAAGLFHVRRGKVTRVVLYWDREHAFADLGLAPEANSPGW
jgi:ketosteroid isomerase-like protein